MHFKLDFEGRPEIGAYIRMTNKYVIVGRSETPNIINFFKEHFACPIVETTINTISTVGSMCAGNSKGLVLPETCTDQELQHIRNALPPSVKVVRIYEKLNALGNTIICNDYGCLVHPDFDEDNIKILEETLGVPVFKHPVGSEPLVGTFAVLSNQGMLTHPNITEVEIKELSEMLKVQVIAGTVNAGSSVVGSGIVANDHVCITGIRCTNVEIKIAETVFNLGTEKLSAATAIDEIVI